MDDSGLEFEELFWFSDAESMARMITDKIGTIESYHDQVEYTSELIQKEPRSRSFFKKFYSSLKPKFGFNSGD